MLVKEDKILDQITGNLNNIKSLLKALNYSNESNAWIIEGPRGIGKATLAKLISINILNITLSNNELNKSTIVHPDFLLLEKEETKKTIPVEDVRKLKNLFLKTSFSGKARIGIIDSINDINNYGHNAMLKLVEEPPANSFIFLIDHLTSIIPATIRSRCKIFKLRELTHKEINQILFKKYKSIDINTANSYSQLSNGSVGDALFYINYNAVDLYNEMCSCFLNLEKLENKKITNFLNKISKDKDKDKLALIFFNLINFLFIKTIKFKSSIIEDYCIEQEKITVKKLQEISYNNLYLIYNLINNYKYNFYYLNTDLHTTMYSLFLEIHKIIINSTDEE